VQALSSTMTNAYGIRVGNVTGGSSLNYAIYTGTGLVRFGDQLGISGTSTLSGIEVNGTINGSGSEAFGLRVRPISVVASNSTFLYGISAQANSIAAGAFTGVRWYGLHAGNPNIGTGSLSIAAGLWIDAITASSDPYAIYTSGGKHRFGDVVNIASASGLQVNGTKVVGAQGATISDPTGGTVQDSEARTAINALIDRLQAHGLIA